MYLDSLWIRATGSFSKAFNDASSKFAALCSSLDALSPLKVLARGYSIVKNNGKIVSSVDDVKIGDNISIDFTDGTAKAVITEVIR